MWSMECIECFDLCDLFSLYTIPPSLLAGENADSVILAYPLCVWFCDLKSLLVNFRQSCSSVLDHRLDNVTLSRRVYHLHLDFVSLQLKEKINKNKSLKQIRLIALKRCNYRE